MIEFLAIATQYLQTLLCFTIFLADGDILRNVHQAAGEVTGLRGLERGVGGSFAGAVGRDEVFKHREAFF